MCLQNLFVVAANESIGFHDSVLLKIMNQYVFLILSLLQLRNLCLYNLVVIAFELIGIHVFTILLLLQQKNQCIFTILLVFLILSLLQLRNHCCIVAFNELMCLHNFVVVEASTTDSNSTNRNRKK